MLWSGRVWEKKRATPVAMLACALLLFASGARTEPASRIFPFSAPSIVPRASAGPANARRSASGVFQTRLAGRHAVGTLSLLASGSAGDARIARLDTTLATTLPGRRIGLRVGDSINRRGAWGAPIRFGGLHYGPDLVQAREPERPSWPTAGRRFGAESVPPAVAQLPPEGPEFAGLAHAAPDFVAPGHVDGGFAAGFIRIKYGLEGDRYGPIFASARIRRGITPDVTTELRSGAQPGVGNCGIAFRVRVPRLGVLSAATAASDSEAGIGTFAQTGFEHSFARFSTSLLSQWVSPEFRPLGSPGAALSPRFWSVARASYDIDRYGVVAMAYAALARVDNGLQRAVRASYRVAVGKVSSLSLSASHAFAPEPETAVMLAMSLSLDDLTRAFGRHGYAVVGSPHHAFLPATTVLR